MKATHIAWAANHHGYEVRVLKDTDTVYVYQSGNNPNDSTAHMDPSEPGAVPRQKLRTFAKRTARDLAQEYGLSELRIFEDEDLLEAT